MKLSTELMILIRKEKQIEKGVCIMLKLGDIEETKAGLEILKNERATEEFLHGIYLSTIRGGIYEYFRLNAVYGMYGLTDAWCDMQYYVSELYDLEMITDEEYNDLLRFINDTYLKSCDKISMKGGKTDVENGKWQRRCNTNCGRDTARNGAGRRERKEDGNA